jgi:hypothetical protein
VKGVSPWAERSREEANLFNPSFLAVLIERLASGHRDRTGMGIPWPLAYVGIPVVLHRPTRDALPSSVNTSMAAWTRGHPLLVSSLAARAQSLRPTVSEALLFGLARREIVREGGTILPPERRRRRPRGPTLREPTEDFKQCAQHAAFFGRWCGESGLPATVMALWGVKP